MARAIWSGAISFGLVSIPVRVFSAVSRKNVQFNQLDSRTNSRIRHKRVSAADDELVDPLEVPGLEELAEVEVSEKELVMAEHLIGSLSEEYAPEKHRDTYRESLLDLIQRKAAGEEIALAPEPASPEGVVDLMAALEASVAEAKEARKRHPTSKPAAQKAKKRTRRAAAPKSA
ncbi:MAG: hypothetical protein GY713_05265 [Actinomycetia bacterium]|nr:hypothetical protein [Actinomycetes bacterium]